MPSPHHFKTNKKRCCFRSTLTNSYIFEIQLAMGNLCNSKGTVFHSSNSAQQSHLFSCESGTFRCYLLSNFYLPRKSVSIHIASSVQRFSLKVLTVLPAVTPDWMIFGKICLCRFMKWFQGIKRLCLVHKCFLHICTFQKVNKGIGQVSIQSIIWMRIWNIVTVKVITVHL